MLGSVLSVIAVVISLGSFAVSVLTYRSAGPRITLSRHSLDIQPFEVYLQVKVVYSGLVVDTSASLAGEIDSINEAVTAVFRSLLDNPSMADIVRVGLIAFSDSAKIIKPLSLVGDSRSTPMLVTGGTTNYSVAFTLVRGVIPVDVASLKVRGLRVFRPVMFFLTDGAPVDPLWQTALDELRQPEFQERPGRDTFRWRVGAAHP